MNQGRHIGRAGIAILGLLLLIFSGLNLPYLHLPYFWDELGVYARAALYLHDHGLSLLPGALPPELSRGHPTLFVFAVGSFFSLFGTELLVGHIYPFLVAVLLVIAVFWAGRKYFHPYVGLAAAILLMAQPVFFAQAGLILPEMQLALLSFLGLHFYLHRLWAPYIIITALAVLTKETAVILPFILTGFEVIARIRENQQIRIGLLLQRTLLILCPIVAFGLFLIVQKMQHGWFFFPYHVGFIQIDFASIKYKLTFFSNFIFLQQGRWVWLLISAVGAALFFWQNHQRIKHSLKQLFLNDVITSYLLTVFILFASFLVSPDMHRYTLILYPFFVIILASIIWEAAKKDTYILIAVTLGLVSIHITEQKNNVFNYDLDADYASVIKVQQKATDYLEKKAIDKKTLKIRSHFPFVYGLQDKRLGYLSETSNIERISTISKNTDYVIQQNPGINIDLQKVDKNFLTKDTMFRHNFAEVVIFNYKE